MTASLRRTNWAFSSSALGWAFKPVTIATTCLRASWAMALSRATRPETSMAGTWSMRSTTAWAWSPMVRSTPMAFWAAPKKSAPLMS